MMITKHVIGNKQGVLRFKIKSYFESIFGFFKNENALLGTSRYICTYIICKIYKPRLRLKFKEKTGRDEKIKFETI